MTKFMYLSHSVSQIYNFLGQNKVMKQSAEDDVVDGDKEEFNDVSDPSHDGESQCTRLSDLFEF